MTDSFFKDQGEDKPVDDIGDLGGDQEESPQGAGFQTEEGRLAAIMSYIPILCFIPLLNMKDNKEAHFHARQGLVLFLVELVAVLFLIDAVSDLVFKVILIAAVGASIAGIYFAIQGKNYKLPIVGDLADKAKL